MQGRIGSATQRRIAPPRGDVWLRHVGARPAMSQSRVLWGRSASPMAHHGRMKELAGRLTALDPDAGAAVRVIAYFDRLSESRAGLEALVRGAAVLSGCPARLVDTDRHVHVRVEPDGTRHDTDTPPDPTWPSAALRPGGA